MYKIFQRPAIGLDKLLRSARVASVYAILTALLAGALITSLFVGRYAIDPLTVVVILAAKALDVIIWLLGMPAALFAPYAHALSPVTEYVAGALGGLATILHPIEHTWPLAMDTVMWQIRFPRSLAVILVGSGLVASGVTFQGTFRNPLVSENILGVSSGASVGACIGILLGEAPLVIQILAFGFGMLAVGLTYFISRAYRSNPKLVMVLSGIIVASLFTAVSSILKYVADPYMRLPAMVFWVMGSFANVSWDNIIVALPFILVPMGILLLIRWRLNILSMGEEEARVLGLDTKKYRLLVIVCATLMTAAAVSVAGVIAWIGLIVPHIGRMIVGPDHKLLLPASLLIGASFMLVVDTICRNLTSVEIPVSIITSVLGAPIFMYLLYKSKETWT